MLAFFRNIREIRDDLRELVITFRFISQVLMNTNSNDYETLGKPLSGTSKASLTNLNEPNNGQKVRSMADFYLENNPDKIINEEKEDLKTKIHPDILNNPDFFGYNGDLLRTNPETLIDINEARQQELEEQKNA